VIALLRDPRFQSLGVDVAMEDRSREDREDRRLAAIAFAIAGGVLRPCAEHGDIVLSIEDADIRDAYRYADKIFKTKEVQKFFQSRRQMKNCIQAAVVEHRSTRCPLCEPTRPN
jgi:hypothetical protein